VDLLFDGMVGSAEVDSIVYPPDSSDMPDWGHMLAVGLELEHFLAVVGLLELPGFLQGLHLARCCRPWLKESEKQDY
jgi:hypothetical protein